MKANFSRLNYDDKNAVLAYRSHENNDTKVW